MTQDTYIIKVYFVKVFKYLSNFHKIIFIYELLSSHVIIPIYPFQMKKKIH